MGSFRDARNWRAGSCPDCEKALAVHRLDGGDVPCSCPTCGAKFTVAEALAGRRSAPVVRAAAPIAVWEGDVPEFFMVPLRRAPAASDAFPVGEIWGTDAANRALSAARAVALVDQHARLDPADTPEAVARANADSVSGAAPAAIRSRFVVRVDGEAVALWAITTADRRFTTICEQSEGEAVRGWLSGRAVGSRSIV